MYATYRIAGIWVQASLWFPGWRLDDIRSICVVQNELDGAGSKAKMGVIHDSVCACESRHVLGPCLEGKFVLRPSYSDYYIFLYIPQSGISAQESFFPPHLQSRLCAAQFRSKIGLLMSYFQHPLSRTREYECGVLNF